MAVVHPLFFAGGGDEYVCAGGQRCLSGVGSGGAGGIGNHAFFDWHGNLAVKPARGWGETPGAGNHVVDSGRRGFADVDQGWVDLDLGLGADVDAPFPGRGATLN